jgi:hypothetical protein
LDVSTLFNTKELRTFTAVAARFDEDWGYLTSEIFVMNMKRVGEEFRICTYTGTWATTTAAREVREREYKVNIILERV